MSVPAYLLNEVNCPDAEAAKPAPPTPLFLPNNAFFPVLDLREFERVHQVDASYSETRRLYVLAEALRETNDEIDGRVCQWVRAGYYTLASVPQDEHVLPAPTEEDPEAVIRVKVLVAAYKQAVYAKAMELLTGRYRGTDSKRYAIPKAELQEEAELNHGLQYRKAIYTLTGRAGSSIYAEII